MNDLSMGTFMIFYHDYSFSWLRGKEKFHSENIENDIRFWLTVTFMYSITLKESDLNPT